MRVTSAESTELFVGPPDAPLQVVRVGYADAAAGEKVRVDGDELVVHPLPSELSPTHAADLDGDGCEEVIEISGLQLRALVPSCE